MSSSSEYEHLAEAIERSVNLSGTKLSPEYYYSSLSMCIIDAVFSIGVRYEGVQNTVHRFCKNYSLRPFRQYGSSYPEESEQLSVIDFINMCSSHSYESLANSVFQNRQRTSARNGILKAEAVVLFAECLAHHGISYFQDISAVSSKAKLEADIRSIKGQGSGISFAYFLMLSGDDSLIKPDRMLLSFASRSLARSCEINELQDLFYGSYLILRTKFPHLSPRLIDYSIWQYERMIL